MRTPFSQTPKQPSAALPSDAVSLLNDIVRRAVAMQASDIHLEPKHEATRVRFRVDGAMVEHPTITGAELHQQLVSRVKVLSRMDIAEKRLPQDGQLVLDIGVPGAGVNMRASTFPSTYGEKVVLRLFSQREALAFDQIGLSTEMQARLREIVTRPQGFLVTCGPTGAGKTSTLYALLRMVDVQRKNVVTLEDPVEIDLPQVTQGQINMRSGFSFAGGLRALLRQDPDVILVGEVRDPETAAIALQAALTGHQVLSTLHTSDTIATIVRLVDLGVEPWIIANALTVIVAQRLVRVVCQRCMAPAELTQDVWDGDEVVFPAGASIVRPRGCDACHGTGYKGRTGIFEVLELDDELRELIKHKGSTAEFRQALRTRRVGSVRRAGFDKVEAGITTVDEVLRVTT